MLKNVPLYVYIQFMSEPVIGLAHHQSL